MRDPRVYGGALDAYTWKNNYLNNSLPQVGGECDFHACTGSALDAYTWQHDYLNTS